MKAWSSITPGENSIHMFLNGFEWFLKPFNNTVISSLEWFHSGMLNGFEWFHLELLNGFCGRPFKFTRPFNSFEWIFLKPFKTIQNHLEPFKIFERFQMEFPPGTDCLCRDIRICSKYHYSVLESVYSWIME